MNQELYFYFVCVISLRFEKGQKLKVNAVLKTQVVQKSPARSKVATWGAKVNMTH